MLIVNKRNSVLYTQVSLKHSFQEFSFYKCYALCNQKSDSAFEPGGESHQTCFSLKQAY